MSWDEDEDRSYKERDDDRSEDSYSRWKEDPITRLIYSVRNMQRDAEKYVTKEEFRPVKILVYGLTGLILTTVMGALIARVITKP